MASGSTFRYLVLERSGARREMVVEAASAAEAVARLRRQGVTPLRELTEATGETRRNLFRRRRRRKFDVTVFFNRLAPLLAARVPLEKALAVIEEGTTDPESAAVVFELRRHLHEGRRFSELLRERPAIFPPIAAGLIEVGEETGELPLVAAELRRFFNESKEFRDFVVTSSIYPLIVVAVTISVVILLFTVFIPRFAKVFEDMGQELPGLTRAMLGISEFMTANWYLAVIAIAVIWLLQRRVAASAELRKRRDRLILALPVFGSLISSVQISNFLQAMAIMCRSRVHLLRALAIARQTLSNQAIDAGFSAVSEQLRAGRKLSEVLGRVNFLPPGTGAMLQVAEESGEVGEMFGRLAAEQQDVTRLKFKRLLAMLEPMVILVLAVMVMAVVLAVFMAIWKMNSIR